MYLSTVNLYCLHGETKVLQTLCIGMVFCYLLFGDLTSIKVHESRRTIMHQIFSSMSTLKTQIEDIIHNISRLAELVVEIN